MPTTTAGGATLLGSEPLVFDEADAEAVVVWEIEAVASPVVDDVVVDATVARHTAGIGTEVCEEDAGEVKDATMDDGVGTWNFPQTKTRARKPPPMRC
jgi:hypothetical protein